MVDLIGHRRASLPACHAPTKAKRSMSLQLIFIITSSRALLLCLFLLLFVFLLLFLAAPLSAKKIAGREMCVAKALRRTRQTVRHPMLSCLPRHTCTILSHWVPLPAPGAPSTKMMVGLLLMVVDVAVADEEVEQPIDSLTDSFFFRQQQKNCNTI